MMHSLFAALAALMILAAPPRAQGEAPGQFDYYVLALSWAPSWCAREGDRRGAAECAAGAARGFTLHGLWPQYAQGWPEFCARAGRDPSRAQSAAMADIMGSAGLAWYQWRKHGRCSGLDGAGYYDAARAAYERITRPALLRRIHEPLDVPPMVIEAAFLESNPDLRPDGVTVSCRDGRLHEVRICLTRALQPRNCGVDIRRDCTLPAVAVPPLR